VQAITRYPRVPNRQVRASLKGCARAARRRAEIVLRWAAGLRVSAVLEEMCFDGGRAPIMSLDKTNGKP
jgi:hypothetical protein